VEPFGGALGGLVAYEELVDRPTGRGVDGGELSDGPDAFELADVERVEGDEIAGVALGIAGERRPLGMSAASP
jgi:hypothetical protein